MSIKTLSISNKLSSYSHLFWPILTMSAGLLSSSAVFSDELPSHIISATTSLTALSEPALTPDVQANLPDYSQQRQLYKLAEKAYNNGDTKQFRRLASSLQDYPLYPYLLYKDFNRQLKRSSWTLSQSQIEAFLHTYNDTVVGDWFRSKLISHYHKHHDWQSVINTYRSGYGIAAECKYLESQLRTKQQAQAYPRIESLWLSAESRPEGCDRLFDLWAADGLKTPELVWQRFMLAIKQGNRRLARYLVRSLSVYDQSFAKQWLKAHKKPQNIQLAQLLKLQHPDQSALLVHWLKRLSSRDIDQTIQHYYQLNDYPFTEQQRGDITRRIGLKLARSHLADAGIWLDRVPQTHINQQVREWCIRTAIRQGDWTRVLEGIAKLNTDDQSRHRWQYWWAYANEELGRQNDAMGIYQYLSSKRSYYGFLAADRLDRPYDFQDRPIEPDMATLDFILRQKETLRAREFYLMDNLLPARREWQRMLKRLDTTQKLAASKLAQLWGWHDRAIVTMGQTRYRDDIVLRFPLHHEQKVHNWSSRHNIDPAWTYAIIRRESAFISDARSAVGALGLMQLMPNTARHVARKLKIRYKGYKSLLASNLNIRLGTSYLERMLDKLDQQVLATAAYNAGPHRVEAWLPESHDMDAMRWIETIPFTETREYVSNVLAYMVIYEHRMKRDITRLSERMPPVPAKNPVLTVTADATNTRLKTELTSKASILPATFTLSLQNKLPLPTQHPQTPLIKTASQNRQELDKKQVPAPSKPDTI